MGLKTKQLIVGLLGLIFLSSLIFVQWMEVTRKRQEAGLSHIFSCSRTELSFRAVFAGLLDRELESGRATKPT